MIGRFPPSPVAHATGPRCFASVDRGEVTLSPADLNKVLDALAVVIDAERVASAATVKRLKRLERTAQALGIDL